jgi:hypothetical protein
MPKYRPGYSFRSSDFSGRDDDDAETGEPCACGIRCTARDYQGNPKRSPRAFCDTDWGHIGDAIRDLPETYAALRLLMLARSGQQEERVSGSREAPVEMDLQVQAFMREIVRVAVSWEDQVRAAAHLADYPDGDRREAVMLAGACKTLYAHLTTLLSLPREDKKRFVPLDKITEREMHGAEIFYDTCGEAWEYVKLGGTDAGLEFLAIHNRARGMRGLTRQRRRITEVPCDQCGGKTLVQYEAKAGDWEPVVRCTACPNSYIGTQFEHLMGRVYSAQVRALGKAS